MNLLKRFYQALLAGLREAGLCFMLGLRDSLAPGLLLRSAGWCLLVTGACLYLYYENFAAIAEFCLKVSFFAVLGVAQLTVVPAAPVTPGVYVDPFVLFNSLVGIVQLALYMGAYFVVLMSMLLLAMVVLGLRLVVHLGLLRTVRGRVVRAYPGLCDRLPQPGESAWRAARYDPAKWLGLSWWTLLSLFIPFYNGLLILLALPFVHVRLMLASAIGPYAQGAEVLAVARSGRVAALFLGVFNLLLLCIPVLNLILPATLCSGACHLYMRALQRHRAQAQLEPAGGLDVAALKGKASAHT